MLFTILSFSLTSYYLYSFFLFIIVWWHFYVSWKFNLRYAICFSYINLKILWIIIMDTIKLILHKLSLVIEANWYPSLRKVFFFLCNGQWFNDLSLNSNWTFTQWRVILETYFTAGVSFPVIYINWHWIKIWRT